MLSVANNHSFMCHVCAKGLLASNFNGVIIYKISKNFHEITPNFTYSQKIVISLVLLEKERPTAATLYGRDI